MTAKLPIVAVLASLSVATPAQATLVGWGYNGAGELGAGYKSPPQDPLAALGPSNVKQITASFHYSLALLKDGTVRGWGGNFMGQLGDGTREASLRPVAVKGLANVTQIAAGGCHVIALLSNGTVMTWGGNAWGTLGNGTSGHGSEGPASAEPIPVAGLSGVVAVAAAGGDDVALLRDGTVVGWGENKYGVLGDGTRVEKDRPTRIAGLSGVKAVALGGNGSLGAHLLALLNDGKVLALGGNVSGQLGDGTLTSSMVPVVVKGLSGVTAISASISHSLALLEGGRMMAWGNDSDGELGIAAPESCGERICSRFPATVRLSNVTAIGAGLRFSVAVSNGRAFAWGKNKYRELGDGNTTNSSVPMAVMGVREPSQLAVGEWHTLAIVESF
jgi:alpha-tubulin suppressor-like RCC1 family protein